MSEDVEKPKPLKRIVIIPGENREDDGPLDLFSYIQNEFDAHGIKARIFEEDLKPGEGPRFTITNMDEAERWYDGVSLAERERRLKSGGITNANMEVWFSSLRKSVKVRILDVMKGQEVSIL